MEQVIFVVSDDAVVRQALTGRIRRESGAHVLPMLGGEPVVAWARALRPALVLVDFDGAPEAAGALARRLIADRQGCAPRIVAVGGTDATGRRCAEAAGCVGRLDGPADRGMATVLLEARQPRALPALARA